MTPEQFRAARSRFQKLGREERRSAVAGIDRLGAYLKNLGINHKEWMTYLDYAGEPALWEEDRGN